MYSGTITSFRQTKNQQAEMLSLGRSRCRRRFSLPTLQISLFNFWTSLILGPPGETKTSTSSTILTLAAAVYIFIKTDPGRAHQPRYPRALPELLAAIAELLARAPTTQFPNVAYSVDNSASHTRGVPHLGEGTSLQLLRLRSESESSDVVYLSGKNNSSYCRSTRTSRRRHQQYWFDCAHLIAKAVQAYSFRANSMASHVGASAWFVSVAFWVCLSFTAVLHPRWFAAPHRLAIFSVLFPRC